MSKTLTVSPSPHIHSPVTVNNLMIAVIVALLPAWIMSVVMFGRGALVVTLISVFSCMLFEALIQHFLLRTKLTLGDGSAAVTGLLLAFNLPANLPVHIIIIGALVAIGVGKMTFGGLGRNPFNPALVGRVFLLISFPVNMTVYPAPELFSNAYIDAATGPTPLAIVKEGLKQGESFSALLTEIPAYNNLFYGNMGGSLGEIAAFALLLGLVYLLLKRVITWHIPVSVIGTIFVFAGLLWAFSADGSQVVRQFTGISLPIIQYNNSKGEIAFFRMADPVFHILTGGVLLGAIFMATDYVTSPMTPPGMLLFGAGIGLITVVIRIFGAYPEGISFAILIMNGFVPLINRGFRPRPFGKEVRNG